jgi:hypothetical protein
MTMKMLPEELLDHILSYVAINHHDRSMPNIRSLLSISRVSKQLKRIAEPYLLRVYDFKDNYTYGQGRTGGGGPALLRHTVEVHLDDDQDRAMTVLEFILCMPHVQVLDFKKATRGRNHDCLQLFRLLSLKTI